MCFLQADLTLVIVLLQTEAAMNSTPTMLQSPPGGLLTPPNSGGGPVGPGMGPAAVSLSPAELAAKKASEREALRQVIQQWNANRLDLFELSEPNEVSKPSHTEERPHSHHKLINTSKQEV